MDSTPKSALGIEGRFRIVKHDVRGMFGSGPDGSVEFEDLWEQDDGGCWIPKDPSRVVEDRTVKNKFTRRGLNFFMFLNMRGLSGSEQTKQTSELTYPASGSTNPFAALILCGDDGASPTRRGDARVLWDESDGQFDDKIPAGSGSAIYGRRACLLSTTTGIFKRVQVRYPTTYEELEYTFFAQANAVAQQTGDNGLDDFVTKSIAMAAGVAAGWNEAASQVGLRAVLGLAGTQQGICDRLYVHENYVYGDGSADGLGSVTPLHKFITAETIDSRHGYVASSEIADTTLLTYSGVNVTMDATNLRITVATASFDTGTPTVPSIHIRKTLTISGMSNSANNQDWTIKRVIGATQVEVFGIVGVTPVDEGPTGSCTAVVKTRNTGDKVFDGRVESEGIITKGSSDADLPGVVISGEKYVSSDVPGPHIIARVWPSSSPKRVRGIRITFPKGSIRDFCPDKFEIRYLNTTHGGSGDPQPADSTDWTLVPGQDYKSVSQVANIFDNGEYGYEYYFANNTPLTCGIGLFVMNATDTSRKVEIASLYIFTEPAASTTITTGANDALKVSRDGGLNYKTFTCPAVAATTSVQTICDALNRVLYGWGLECLRSTFGYFWLRATVGGSYCSMILDVVANSIYGTLFPGVTISGPTTRTGVTQALTKAYTDALTIIYTPRMAGNLPKP